MESKRASELQEGGRHYKDMPIQPAEFCQRNRLNWCESNAIKYVVRHASKNGAQDIRKAIHYLNLLLEWEYPAHGKTAADYTPLAPEEVKAINDAVSPPSLCGTCIRQGCPVDCAEHTTECVNYLAPKEEVAGVEVDEWAERDLCRRCGNTELFCDQGKEMQMAACGDYVAKIELDRAEFGFSFPPAEKFMGQLTRDYIDKLREEVQEVSETEDVHNYAIELMDVIHVAETALRTLANGGMDIQDLADHVIAKNRQRGYYTKG